MKPPSIKGHEIRTEIGSGSSGVVYEALREDGTRVAVKVLESMGSNPSLIRNRIKRLMESGSRNVTVPILAEALDVRPACLVMPLMAEVVEGEGEAFVPNNLQTHLADYLSTDQSWPLILKLINRLAALHTARVAHGNLKPGNIFFNDDGMPLFSDYASGLMPGVHHLSFSDSLLYAPPEQLRNPDAYSDEAGYRWDVFAFGVLAFRLLTGKFPRCQSIFEGVCPAAGEYPRVEIEAEHEGIAAGLEEDERLSWPDQPADAREERRREMINFCLMLDPQGRPADMREVARRFESIESDLATEAENVSLIKDRRKAERRRGLAMFLVKGLLLVALALAGMWGWTEFQRRGEARQSRENFDAYQTKAEGTITSLEESTDKAQKSENEALTRAKTLQLSLDQEQSKSESELSSAQLTNEELLSWILEEGIAGLPALEGRQGRLALLAREMEKQLKGMESRPALAKQAALLQLRHAEVLLASGKSEEGLKLLDQALAKGDGKLAFEDEARARIRYLLLASRSQSDDLTEKIVTAERMVSLAWPQGNRQHIRALAALNLVKGRIAEGSGKKQEAQESYQKSLAHYEELTKQFPETPALRMGLGRAYQEAALTAEGGGDFDNAAALRAKAAEAFLKLSKNPKNKTPELEFQIASVTAARAVSEWQNGQTFTAEKLARQGIERLTVLSRKIPSDFRVTVALASQQGIIATILRDEGKATAAADLLKRAIANVESGLKLHSTDWNARYLFASLKWQLSGILGQQGQHAAEVKLGTEARDQLRLILDAKVQAPHPSRVRLSLAYLCGDLGHSAHLSGQRNLGISFLKESKGNWQTLLAKDPNNAEALDGNSWVSQRLRELGVK